MPPRDGYGYPAAGVDALFIDRERAGRGICGCLPHLVSSGGILPRVTTFDHCLPPDDADSRKFSDGAARITDHRELTSAHRRVVVDAAKRGDLATVERLLRSLDSALHYALHIAATSGQPELASVLLAAHRFSDEALEECEGTAWQHDHHDVADLIGLAKIEID